MSTFIAENPIFAFLVPAAAAAVALMLCAWLYVTLRRLRRDQKLVLGDQGSRDVIAHARALEERIGGLSGEIARLASKLELEGRRLDDCLSLRSVVRYDAYRDLSGMQSSSVCLIDSKFSGFIISSIQSRDHARIYVREVRHGEGREQLSPEEIQVLTEAMGLKEFRKLGHAQAQGGGNA